MTYIPAVHPAPDTFYTVKKGICRLEQTSSRAADTFFLLYCVSFGYWKNSEEIRKNWALEHTFLPKQEENWRKEVRKGWKKAVSCAGGWARDQHPSKDL